MTEATLQQAFELIYELARDFQANIERYKSPDYQEAEVRKDYIDKNYFTTKCGTLDRQLDVCVWELYGMQEEERKVMEGER